MKPELKYLIVLFTLLLAACSPSTPGTQITQPASSPTSPVVETALSGVDFGSATATFIPEALVIPTPSSQDKVTITGRLMVNRSNPRPAPNIILGLANILDTDAGTPGLASFDPKVSPRTLTDASGRFVFADVPVDRYSLVLDKITESYLLTSPDDGSDMLFFPGGGQVLDLGQLVYTQLPGYPTPEP